MTEVVPFPPIRPWEKYGSSEAEYEIRLRVETTNNVILGLHAGERIEERGIDRATLFNVLRHGHVDPDSMKLNERGDWECRVTQRVKGHREACAVTIIVRADKTLFIKTAMWID